MRGEGEEKRKGGKREKRVSYKTVNRVSLSKIVAGRVVMSFVCNPLYQQEGSSLSLGQTKESHTRGTPFYFIATKGVDEGGG